MAEELNEGRVAYLEALVRSLNDTIGELRAELSETRVALEAERLDRYGAVRDRDLLNDTVGDLREIIANLTEDWRRTEQGQAADRDLLLWLHAEAAWWLQLDRDEHESAEMLAAWFRRAEYAEARYKAAKQELSRLRREVEFEARAEEFFDDWSDLALNPVCACSIDATALPAGWSVPQCAVHQDGGTA